MPCRHAYIVQGFDAHGEGVERFSRKEYGSAHQAVLDAARLALETSGVIVFQLNIDTVTGMAMDGPYCLARFGTVPSDYDGLPKPAFVMEDVH